MSGSLGTGRTHSGSRLIRAPAEAIYAAFMNPAAMARWRPPAGMRMRIDEFDPREGGSFRLILEYQGKARGGKSSKKADIVNGRFEEIAPERKIVEQVVFESDDPAFAGIMVVTTTLTPVDGGTEVTIRCDDVPEGISEAEHEAGIASTLENLARYVE